MGHFTQEISLYFHIPFCSRKCDYCHFYVLPDKEELKNQLLEGFELELNILKPYLTEKKIVTVYFGGGTPALFGAKRIDRVLKMIRDFACLAPDAEITLEANPENITCELMQDYAETGINRVSIGVQTLDPNLLTLLGRLHSPDKALNAIISTHRAGITNISIDLMYDLPKQTLEHWLSTLNLLKGQPIQHLSLYNLTIEPHTIFFKRQKELIPLLPSGELSLSMYEKAVEHLEKLGLCRYEISAFAQPGFESKHNTGYWIGRPFFGLGPSAFSHWEGKRFQNIAHLGRYHKALKEGRFAVDFEEILDPEASRRELFVIQIRLKEGVNLKTFNAKRGALDQPTLETIERLIREGFLTSNQDRLSLTSKGILFYDTVASELI